MRIPQFSGEQFEDNWCIVLQWTVASWLGWELNPGVTSLIPILYLRHHPDSHFEVLQSQKVQLDSVSKECSPAKVPFEMQIEWVGLAARSKNQFMDVFKMIADKIQCTTATFLFPSTSLVIAVPSTCNKWLLQWGQGGAMQFVLLLCIPSPQTHSYCL